MADSDGQERTEDPTPKRIDQFYKEGHIPRSREIDSIAILTCGVALIFAGAPLLYKEISDLVHVALAQAAVGPDATGFAFMMTAAGNTLIQILLPLFLALAAVSLISSLGQTGWHPKETLLKVSFDHLNPLMGIKRIFFSPESLLELLKSLFKVGVVGIIVWKMITKHVVMLIEIPKGSLSAGIHAMSDLLHTFVWQCLLCLGAIAVIDSVVQRYLSWQRLKMTRNELKDEARETEGNPQIKSRLRQIYRERLKATAGLKDVKTADVVITNPTHYAVALKYASGTMRAPKVVAKGQDHIAQLILEEARKHGIPRIENRLLARTLHKIARVGDEIPPQLYEAVATVLAYVYRIRSSAGMLP